MRNEMPSVFSIDQVLDNLKEKRKLFVSEADFQLELAWEIKELYPTFKIRLEYSPSFAPSMHLDILVITDEELWIPIELKYKTKDCIKSYDGENYVLKNHGAKDISCYLYLQDIERIEFIKSNCCNRFFTGYTIFLTNDLTYEKQPQKSDCFYRDFSLAEGSIKEGTLAWDERTGSGTRKGHEKPIVLSGCYPMHWKEFSQIDQTSTGTFKYTINQIE